MKKYNVILLLLICSLVHGQETIKIMTYNLLNYPGSTSSQRNPYFHKTINEVKPEILVVQEMISQEGVDEFYNEVLSPVPMNYKSGTFLDGPDSDNQIFFDSTKFTLLSNIPISTALRDINQFTLHHPHSNDTLIIFSVHLKSSSGSSNETLRLAEVDSLRKVTSDFSPNKYFLVCGDFNFYKSTELAYIELLDQSKSGYFVDPITTMSGTWNNSAYASYHTQSTRTASFGGGTTGGLDDRFDLILFSQSLIDFGGITYVSDSYTNFGNDGEHYNLEIFDLPNNAVADSIAEALYQSSDHLPVIAEVVFENAMPVELISFNGYNTESGVFLEWGTVTETNNYGFEIQKSVASSQNSEDTLSGVEEWAKVGFVQGHGTTNSPRNYEFTDSELPNTETVDYRLKQIDNDGTFAYSKTITVDLTTITSVEDEEMPTVYLLEQNYPNPFNPTTTIKFSIASGTKQSEYTTLKIYNMLGQEVRTLVSQKLLPGNHEVKFDGSNLPSGMYIYRISVGDRFNSVKKMLMVK